MRKFTWLAAVLLLTACTQAAPEGEPAPTASAPPALDADYTVLAGGEPPSGGPLTMAKKMTDPKQAQLIGPTYAARFDWTATLTQVGPDDFRSLGLQRPMAAPAGHEIFFAHVAQEQPSIQDSKASLPPATVQLVVDGKPRTLIAPAPEPRRTLMAVTPVGAPIQLVVTDQGRTQTLDLRTGKRGDAISGFYQSYAMEDLELRSERRSDPDLGTLYARGDLSLVPWTPDNGWAPKGKAWLTFETSPFQILGWVKDSTLDTKRSFAVVAGGKTYPAVADGLYLNFAGTTTGHAVPVVFSVPAGLRKGTLRLTPHAKCNGCHLGPGDSTSFSLAPVTP